MSLSFHQVAFRYPRSADAPLFADFSLRVEPGQFVAIVGSSGCGKSTLLHLAAGLLEPERGQVERSPGHSLMFQTHALLPWLRVVDNVAIALEAQGIAAEPRRNQARAELSRFGLAACESWFPGQLSIGMQQRVALARALVVRPQLLLLDEPFAALDAATRRVLQRDLVERWKVERNTVVLVTHDLTEATLLADRVLVLGRSTDDGRTTDVVEDIELPEPRRCFDQEEPSTTRATRLRLWQSLEAETRFRLGIGP